MVGVAAAVEEKELKELSVEAPAFSGVSLFSASTFRPEWPAPGREDALTVAPAACEPPRGGVGISRAAQGRGGWGLARCSQIVFD